MILSRSYFISLEKMTAISQAVFRSIFVKEKICILIKMSLKFVPKAIVWTKAVPIHWRIYAAL